MWYTYQTPSTVSSIVKQNDGSLSTFSKGPEYINGKKPHRKTPKSGRKVESQFLQCCCYANLLKEKVDFLSNCSIVSVSGLVLLAVSDNGLGLSDLSLALSELLAGDNDVGGSRVDAGNDLGLVGGSVETLLVDRGGSLSVLAVHGDVNNVVRFGLSELLQDREDQNGNDDDGEEDTNNDDGDSGAVIQM